MSPFHYLFDKLYPLIRFYHEKVSGNEWFTEITPQLWLGGAPTYERDYQSLLQNNINAVVNIRAEREDDVQLYRKHGIEYLTLPVFDMNIPDAEHFDVGVAFIDKQVREGDRVLIHCAKGRGRSAVLLAAYLMRHQGMTFDEAVDFMKQRRRLVKQERRHKQAAESWLEKAVEAVEQKAVETIEEVEEEKVEELTKDRQGGKRGFG